MSIEKPATALKRLLEIMVRLRSPEGCPWDAQQTPESLKPYLLEEAYEVMEAIDSGRPSAIRDELGDLLLQIVFHSRIFEERGLFEMADVIEAITDKLVRRHPHVFDRGQEREAPTLSAQWDQIKAREDSAKGENPGTFGRIPVTLPALQRAGKVAERANRLGLGQDPCRGTVNEIREKLDDLEKALIRGDRRSLEHRFGDLLFTMVRLGQFCGIDAEESLRQRTRQFIHRFERMEKLLADRGRSIQQCSPEELQKLWRENEQDPGRKTICEGKP